MNYLFPDKETLINPETFTFKKNENKTQIQGECLSLTGAVAFIGQLWFGVTHSLPAVYYSSPVTGVPTATYVIYQRWLDSQGEKALLEHSIAHYEAEAIPDTRALSAIVNLLAVEQLLGEGSNKFDTSGLHLLDHVAISNKIWGKTDLTHRLIKSGMDPFAKNGEKNSVFENAVKRDDKEAIEIYKQYGDKKICKLI